MTSIAPIFTDWTQDLSDNWGKAPLRIKHRLHQDTLFCEDVLAELIDVYPVTAYDLVMMGEQGKRHLWREGEKGDLTGAQVIEMIRNRRFWINLRNVGEVDSRYGDLLKQMFNEIEDHVPSLGPTFKHKMGILISSPMAQVYYHADIPGQSLWQISGSKRVLVYPNSEHFLPQEAMERIVLGETEEDLPYQPSFDDDAMVCDLEPGEMLTWPLNGPHRVMNHDCLNISVTTEHWTPAIRNSYAAHFANGVLRNRFGVSNPTHDIESVGLYPKLALAAGWKYLGLQKGKQVRRAVDFRFDDNVPDGFVDVEAYPKPA